MCKKANSEVKQRPDHESVSHCTDLQQSHSLFLNGFRNLLVQVTTQGHDPSIITTQFVNGIG